MSIEVKVNEVVKFTSEVAKLHDVKSEYGKLFYHSPEVLSVEVTLDGITFLQLQKDENGKMINRFDMKSED